MGSKIFVLMIVIAMVGVVFAGGVSPTSPTSKLQAALSSLCEGLRQMVPVAAMLMVLLAAVIYASGQMMGAETRARANVWATSCLTGALIGIMIAVIAPVVLGSIAGSTVNC